MFFLAFSIELTFLSLMNQVMYGEGLEGEVVQFASNLSPTAYVCLVKLIFGSLFCGSINRVTAYINNDKKERDYYKIVLQMSIQIVWFR